jgi:hypothetical protein
MENASFAFQISDEEHIHSIAEIAQASTCMTKIAQIYVEFQVSVLTICSIILWNIP